MVALVSYQGIIRDYGYNFSVFIRHSDFGILFVVSKQFVRLAV